MNIVIVGIGEIGQYIAAMLSKEEHNVILVDQDRQKLQEASISIDVAIKHGGGTDWQLLDDLLELSPHLLLALSEDDETNLVACSIAKQLGYPRTICRVRDNRFLNRTRLDFAHIFDVDYFICPELLVAGEMLKYMVNPGSLAVEYFAHGAVQLRTFMIPDRWRKEEIPLAKLDLPEGVVVGLIRRRMDTTPKEKVKKRIYQVIFPHGTDTIKPHDEVTFIGETDVISDLHHFFGLEQRAIKSAVIVGGSHTGVHLAKHLESKGIEVRLIEKKYDRCKELAELMPECTIMHHDATDLDFLKSEKIGRADVFVSCTHSDEVNLLTGMLGKEVGCEDVMTMLSNTSYAPLIKPLGINHAVSPRISAANHILSQILSGKVTSLVSFYENQVEVMEVLVSMDSKVVGIPLAQLGPLLPKDLLIGMIQNRGRVVAAHGNRIISPGDTVIVITSPRHAKELEKIF